MKLGEHIDQPPPLRSSTFVQRIQHARHIVSLMIARRGEQHAPKLGRLHHELTTPFVPCWHRVLNQPWLIGKQLMKDRAQRFRHIVLFFVVLEEEVAH